MKDEWGDEKDDGFGEDIKPLPPLKNVYWEAPKKNKDPSVTNIIGTFVYRGRKVIHTTDKRYTATKTWGILMPSVFVVRDDFDDYCLPVGEDVFFTPHEAIMAIHMMDDILPTIRKGEYSSRESLESAYREMRLHYRSYYAVHAALTEIERCVFAKSLNDKEARDEIFKSLNRLRRLLNSNRHVIHH